MVEEQRVRELELRMDIVVGRLDEMEAAVAGRPVPGLQAPVEAPARASTVTVPEEWAATAPESSHGEPGPERPPLAPVAAGPPPAMPPARPAPRPRRSPADLLGDRSLEDLLGGRVLAWMGGLAVLVGVAFLFAVGVSQGWIGEGARTLVAGAGASALLAVGIWLHERRGRTDAALAAVATGISALFVTLTVGAQVYDVLPAPVALGLALAVGALGTSLAVRWEARGIAALGILGGLFSPILAGAPSDLGTMAILLVASASAVGVLLRLRWDWLSFGVFLVTVPQWGAYLAHEPGTLAAGAVLAGFGLLGAAAAVGYEVRVAAETIRQSSAFLLSLNALAIAAGGWIGLSEAGHEVGADLWIAGVAATHIGVGLWSTRSGRTSHALGLLSLVIGAVLADVAFAAFVDGPARAIGFAGAGVMLAMLVKRGRLPAEDGKLTALGLGVHISLALLQAITADAPPALLDTGDPLGIGATVSLAGVAAACLVSARLAEAGQPRLRIGLDVVGLAVAAYLTALLLDGAMLTLAWSLEAVALAHVGSRARDAVAHWGARAHVALASAHALAVVAPLSAIVSGPADLSAAIVALGSVAAAAAGCALLTRDEPELRAVLEATAMATAAYLAAVTLDGAALVVVLAAGGALLCEVSRRFGGELTGLGGLAYLGGALLHALVFEAPPAALVTGVEAPVAAAIAVGAVVLAALASGRPGGQPEPIPAWLLGSAAVVALYLASVLVVTPFQPGNPGAEASLLDLDVRQQGQVLLSALWCLAGFGALVVGLRGDMRLVRLGGLALLLVTVGKVFMFDLATLTSIYRVASFIALGLFLLTAAFVWQRMRPRPLPDMREAPAGIR